MTKIKKMQFNKIKANKKLIKIKLSRDLVEVKEKFK